MRVVADPRLVRGLTRPVLAIGIFDGMHRGHRRIIRAAVAHSRRIRGTAVVLTFWPHPRGKKSVYSLKHRLRLIAELGADVCVTMRFGPRLARVSARDFVRRVIAGQMRAQAVYVGENFRFGHRAAGDVRLLARLGREYGFRVHPGRVVSLAGAPVSSTLLRALISSGELAAAKRLMLRPVSVYGTVVRGDRRGRRLGFPTANVDPHHEVLPPAGVYAVRVVIGSRKYPGLCNIGCRPTFGPARAPQRIEVHVFDYKKTLYRRDIEILFIRRLRDERRFACPAQLVLQIKQDVAAASRLLSHRS